MKCVKILGDGKAIIQRDMKNKQIVFFKLKSAYFSINIAENK